ncbi:MAG: penicillin-binding transpeptidase domain-containing protein [Candidatus Stygibacter australis]|nr:penicillin-binding transpeptidase domain-containing protein [Candidatus Stygibacter australis]MDP8320953.1 penicillin-binding transpeptidase domain-containing protein [Candidatus Stygibacter australis]
MDSRLKIFQILMYLILVYIVFHLIVITLFDPFELSEEIDTRHKISKLQKYYHRGNIYDRNGNLLVTTQYYYQLDLDKGLIHKVLKDTKKEGEVYNLISEVFSSVTGRDKGWISERINSTGISSIFLADKLQITEIKAIKTQVSAIVDQNPEFEISNDKLMESLHATRLSEKRVYPYQDLAPRLLGLAMADTSQIISPDEQGERGHRFKHLKGRCGIERTFENLLSGENGWQEVIKDALGDKVLKPSLKSRTPIHGQDVYLTINVRYQEILEEKLHEGLLKYKAKNAMGVIMDVHTGEILALAGEQENDHNESTATLRSYSNLPVSYCMEPGSTMKPITALLALEDNLYSENELIDCSPLVFDYGYTKRTIRDHELMGKLPLEGVIVHSSNPGISRVAILVGKEKLWNRYNDMGLGRQTLSEIYGESKGIFRNPEDWSEYSLCSIAFGQEISLNMLHMAVIYASFANQGNILQPQILSYSKNQFGQTSNKMEPKIFRRISQPAHIKTIQRYLRNVVKEGTATATDLDYIEISGKTGTSEIITKDINGKIETRHNSLFAGYLPSNDPRIVIVVAFDRCIEDKNKYYFASQSAVPTFREVVKNILLLKDCDLVTSTTSYQEEIAILPNLIGLKKQDAVKILKDMEIDYSFINNSSGGIISDQYPPANIKFSRRQQVKLALAQPGEIITDKKLMPDFKGLSLRAALELARTRFITLTANGNGVVVDQSIKPQTEISLEDGCHLTLK